MITFFKCPTKPKVNCPSRGLLTQCKGCGDIILKEGETPMTLIETMMVYRSTRGQVVAMCNCAMRRQIDPSKGTEPCDAEIPHYDSIKEAHEAGWRYTNHIKFCPPDASGQWVCPECAKDFNWEGKTIELTRAYDSRVCNYSQEAIHGK